MQEISESPAFVFDANFFICLKQAKAERPFKMLETAKSKLKIDMFVSAMVFNECPFIVGQDFQEFSKGISIELVPDSELDQIKHDLGIKGVQAMAQDPDLTLVALAKRLKNKYNDVCIVSDDFKLSQNVETLQYRIKFWSLPAFLQFLAKNLAGSERDYFKIMRKRVLKLNLDYMLSRNDIYPAQAKMAWLLENAVSVADEGITLKNEALDDLKKQEQVEAQKELFTLSQNYIDGKSIPKEKQQLISPYEAGLKRIISIRKLISSAKDSFMTDDEKKASSSLKKAQETLMALFQYIAATYRKKEFRFLELIMASEIAKVGFLRAFLLIGKNKLALALEALRQTSLFASLARMPDTVLTINFLIALIHMFESGYEKAIEQFRFLRQLSDAYEDRLITLKSYIGEMITLYLIGQHDDAINLVPQFRETAQDDLELLSIALLDSGDYFYNMGFPEIASNLYSNTLEVYLDLGKKLKTRSILSKMKKSYMGSALIGNNVRPSADISVLIDKFYDCINIDGFNDAMQELAEFTNKLYAPFELMEQKKANQKKTKDGKKVDGLIKFSDLPSEMKGEFECVKIQENPETDRTLLIVFREEIGLIAFDVLLDHPLEGVPENYSIELRKDAQIKIKTADIIKEALFLIRAIIYIPDLDRDLKITRNIPAFFGQMKI
jgi:tetratricopeptide (TPR) repeat protein